MIHYKGFSILQKEDSLSTVGLKTIIGKEILVQKGKHREEEYVFALKYLIDYSTASKKTVKPEETISYFSWIIKFIEEEKGFLSLFEATINGEGFSRGIDHAITLRNSQVLLCERNNISPLFPGFDQNVVISEGVYQDLSISGVRYPSPNYMTGWWLTTDLYDGKIESLVNVHFFHVAFKRPDIMKFLALPYGFRFYLEGEKSEVWFDARIMEEQ